MKVYLAHSKLLYNTIEETKAVQYIHLKGWECLNPKNMRETGDITSYLRAIDECDGLVAMEYEGHIGKGVYSEVVYALNKKHCGRVWVYRNGVLFPVKTVILVNARDWKIGYGKIIARIPEGYKESRENSYEIF